MDSTVADLHRRVCVADGHSDSLMWNRDLTEPSEEGHVDFPRLAEAGVKLQCFTVVTRGIPVIDGFSLFARRQRWPERARTSEWTRCVWQLERMAAFCLGSQGTASIAGRKEHLDANLSAGRLSVVLGIEGAHAIEGDVSRVKDLHERGVRFMSLTHLANNELGGTSTPFFGNRPLTQLGRDVMEAMADVGMLLDVAHASPAMLKDVVSHPRLKPFCSHTGVQGATKKWRNLPDETLKAIADRGGVVGIIFAPQFIGGKQLSDVARHVRHAVDVMGEDGVALGSDFDGMIPLPQGMRDVRDLPKLTQAMLDSGLSTRVVEKVLGDNFRRMFSESL